MKQISFLILFSICFLIGCNNTTSTQTKSKRTLSSSEMSEKREFVSRLESGFNNGRVGSGMTQFSLSGDRYETLHMLGEFIDQRFYEKFKQNRDIIRTLRQNDFDSVILDNGKQQWKYDLWSN